MKPFFYSTLIFLCFFSFASVAQTANDTWAVKFSNAIVARYQPNINTMTGKKWEYSNSIITHGMEKVYDDVPDSIVYLNYIKAYVDAYVNSSGVINATLSSLDRVHPGISCLFLYEKTGLTKYKTAATTLRNLLVGPSSTYSKTSNGILWHKLSGYNNISMLDGIYMAHPFLAKYGSMFNDAAAIDTAVDQTLFMYYQLYDPATHLIKHAWTSTPSSYPSAFDATSGNSHSFWSRAMGWYMMALVDELKYVPSTHARRSELLTALANLSVGIKNYQDPTTGLWWQVLDKGSSLSGNYLETSGSAMFVYALKVASDSGWINSSTYLPVAQAGWTGLQTEIDTYTDGMPRINNFAPGMSYQNNDAAYAAVSPVSCPVSSGTQNPHGYAGILMAASVMEFPLYTTLPVRFSDVMATQLSGNIKISWEYGNSSQVSYYTIERSTNGTNFSAIGTVKPGNSSKYEWTDSSANAQRVYYRIKEQSPDGKYAYSSVVALNLAIEGNFSKILIAPNPVKDGVVRISMKDLKRGDYQLNIISTTGNVIVKKFIDVTNGSAISATLQLPESARGIYYLVVETKDFKTSKQIIVN